jgi:hypothetical protein
MQFVNILYRFIKYRSDKYDDSSAPLYVAEIVLICLVRILPRSVSEKDNYHHKTRLHILTNISDAGSQPSGQNNHI